MVTECEQPTLQSCISSARLSKDSHLFVHVCSALSEGQLWAHAAEHYSDV